MGKLYHMDAVFVKGWGKSARNPANRSKNEKCMDEKLWNILEMERTICYNGVNAQKTAKREV